MNDLRTAAQQALEALEDARTFTGAWPTGAKAIAALRAALAQEQTEPVEPVAWDVTKNGRLIYDYDFTHDVSLRVMGDFEDDEQRVRYAKQIVDKLNATLAQQDEPDLSRCPQCNGPADNGFDRSIPPNPYLCTKCMAEPVQEPAFHGFMSDDGTQVDVCFSPSAPRRDGTYATAYYTAPPQRTMVPLTAQELDGVIERHVGGSEITDDMYTSMEQFARAVEKASREKNNG